MITEVNDCQITELVVRTHGSDTAKGLTEDQTKLAFRHLMRCPSCRTTLDARDRAHFVSSFVLTLD